MERNPFSVVAPTHAQDQEHRLPKRASIPGDKRAIYFNLVFLYCEPTDLPASRKFKLQNSIFNKIELLS